MNEKRIFCFGDSNTWGLIPGSQQRFDETIRWTALLQKALGRDYRVIEDGLCGRSAVYPDPKAGRYAAEPYFTQALQIHAPISTVIIALGTNDLKAHFNLSSKDVTHAIKKLAIKARNANDPFEDLPKPTVLVVAPPQFGEITGERAKLFSGARKKQPSLANDYIEMAQDIGVRYCYSTSQISPSPIDGVHLDKQGHYDFFQRILLELQSHRAF